MENTPSDKICPKCTAPVSPTVNFCPHCGEKLNEPPLSTTIGRQIFIYLISFFLAPFGLAFAFKYLRRSDPKAKKIGLAVIALTILAIMITIWTAKVFTAWEYHYVDGL